MRRVLMEYSQFLNEVETCIKHRYGEEYQVEINRVMKNNSVAYDGLVIFKEGNYVSPNIYLNQYYPSYQEGASLEQIVDEIMKIYSESEVEKAAIQSQFEFEFSYEALKDHIFFRLINYGRNKKLLEEVPHIRFLDLAITFHCLMKQDETGIGTIRLMNEHLEAWGVTVKELMRLASENTKRLFPPRIRSMQDVLKDIFAEEYLYQQLQAEEEGELLGSSQQCEQEAREHLEQMDQEKSMEVDPMPMYIMSNKTGINGATVMIYKNEIKNFAYQLDTDFFILPSSIHEVILVPYGMGTDIKALQKMVMEVNASEVPEEEVLSDHVYIYHRDTNTIEL